MKVFRFFYNHVGENEGTRRAPLQGDGDTLPEYRRFINLIMEVSLRQRSLKDPQLGFLNVDYVWFDLRTDPRFELMLSEIRCV